MNSFRFIILSLVITFLLLLFSCEDYYKNDFKDNTPTSGRLNVYYDEGLELHVKNQAYTFHSQYTNANINLFERNDDQAIEALYNDSCEAIIISRPLKEKEKKAFESKGFFPKFSSLAYSGLVFVTNINSSKKVISHQELVSIFGGDGECMDSLSNPIKWRGLIDKNNSSILHYVLDSVLLGRPISKNASALKSTLEALDFVSENNNTIACIDFAWLSDLDDSITKSYLKKIKILGINLGQGKIRYPSQSSFKLKTYPYTRLIYYYRKTGDFTLAKGFESFVAGPKGQTIFLKQGLLPFKQQERLIEVKFQSL